MNSDARVTEVYAKRLVVPFTSHDDPFMTKLIRAVQALLPVEQNLPEELF